MQGKSSELSVRRSKHFGGEISVPGDKSISHRAVMLAGLSNGRCEIDGFLPSEDCLSTVGAMRSLGIQVDVLEESELGPVRLLVHGLDGRLQAPAGDIDCGNSGTTMRLLSGILAGQPFASRLVGDASLSRRPMGRVVEPLQNMGCQISADGEQGCAPLEIRGGGLKGTRYELPVASAQVKSAVLLAGLFAEGKTTVVQPQLTRDHTERMLEFFQVKTLSQGDEISIYGGQTLESRDFTVPGDISSAAFWAVAAQARLLYIRPQGIRPQHNPMEKACGQRRTGNQRELIFCTGCQRRAPSFSSTSMPRHQSAIYRPMPISISPAR